MFVQYTIINQYKGHISLKLVSIFVSIVGCVLRKYKNILQCKIVIYGPAAPPPHRTQNQISHSFTLEGFKIRIPYTYKDFKV